MLFKKMLRDLKHNKSQFITIFLMVFLAVFAFSGIHAYMDGMKFGSEEYYKKQNLQDLWVTKENFSKEDLEKVKELDNVNNAERLLRIKANVVNPEDYTNKTTGKELKEFVIECNFIESNDINQLYVQKGEKFDVNKSGLWFDEYLAENLGIKIGDEIELSYEGLTLKEKVVAIVEAPDHVYFMKDETAIFPTHTDYGFAYLSINELPEMFHVFPYMIVDVDDLSQLKEVKASIKENIDNVITVTDREDDISYSGFLREAEEGESYSGIFSGLFVFIAILSVVTTMNRFVKRERTQIGTLKALGIKKRKITWMYVNYGFFISVVAGVLGLFIGRYTLGSFFLNMELVYYEIPYLHTYLIPLVYEVAIGIVIVITLVTYLSCRKILKEKAAEAIRVEIPKVKISKFDITTKGIFKRASLSTKWNLRDVLRNRARTFMALVGIMGCTMLVVVALGMFDSLNEYMRWEFEVINHFDYRLNLSENYTDSQYEAIIEKYGEKTSQSVGVEFKNDDEIELNALTINDAKGLLQTTDHNKKPFEMKNDGIYITEKMSKLKNLKVGDTVEWRIVATDKWYKSKIAGLAKDPQNQQFYCTKDYFETLEETTYRPDSIYTNKDLSKIKEINGVNTIQSIGNIRSEMDNMLQMMFMVIYLLIGISIALGFVIIYNLGILSFTEKEYQFATLKVLGYKNKQIKKIFIKQNIWITIVAILLSFPVAFWVTDYIFANAIGDIYDFNAYIRPITYAISGLGSFIVSYLINKFLARKINKIDMVSSLKGNE
ncbi:MAG: ABC transporter permease [Clostridia bacterium]|nr:ABC transporter permease [Clostridia bacterium]